MEGYGYGRGRGGGRGREEREIGDRGRGRGRGTNTGRGGGRGRENQQFQYHQQPPQQYHQQPPQQPPQPQYHQQRPQQPPHPQFHQQRPRQLPHPHFHKQRPQQPPQPQFNQSSSQGYFRQSSSQGDQWGSRPMSVSRGGSHWRPANTAAGEGFSGGQQQLSSDNYAAKLRQSSEAHVDREVNLKMQSLKLSEETSQSSETGVMMPVQRPDNGGRNRIRNVNILVNHFPVSFNPESIIGHYDIDVKPVASARGRPLKMSKAILSMVMDKVLTDNREFPLEMTAYDGEKNIFSAVSLPIGEFAVTLSPEEDVRCHSFMLKVTLVNELKLHKLRDYLTGNLLQLPREVLQGMDVVMKENPRRCMVSIGKSFYPKDPKDYSLGRGLVASHGFLHSLKPTSQGLALCLDYSVLAVRKRVSVLQFLRECVDLTVVNFDSFCRKRKDIENAVKGLKVTVTHRRTKQKYVVSGLTDQKACDIFFTVEDPDGQLPPTSVCLLDYFRDKYPEAVIDYEDLPCLSVGKGNKANYVPIELCLLVEGQRYPKENLDYLTAKFLKNLSLAEPENRRSRICSILRDEHGPCGSKS